MELVCKLPGLEPTSSVVILWDIIYSSEILSQYSLSMLCAVEVRVIE